MPMFTESYINSEVFDMHAYGRIKKGEETAWCNKELRIKLDQNQKNISVNFKIHILSWARLAASSYLYGMQTN
jgi:hypothetical protein